MNDLPFVPSPSYLYGNGHKLWWVMYMEAFPRDMLRLLPESVRAPVAELAERLRNPIEEIRLRVGGQCGAVTGGREICLRAGNVPLRIGAEVLQDLVDRACGYSVYSVAEQLGKGYLSLPGGHRLGICGTVVRSGASTFLKNYSAVALRIARQLPGAADSAVNLIWSSPRSTLIIGAPGLGKTTILRELICQLSDRFHYRVCAVDERGELAASVDGHPQLKVGKLTDVLTGGGKAEGIELLLRSMRPEWIAVDEITAEEDVTAMLHASYCGVRLLATAHAFDPEDLQRRPLYRRLMDERVFDNLIVICADRSLQCERIGEEL